MSHPKRKRPESQAKVDIDPVGRFDDGHAKTIKSDALMRCQHVLLRAPCSYTYIHRTTIKAGGSLVEAVAPEN
ncbi:hypothetical protein TrVFT333_009064 [Trichoderma virens FT-333]|nr:hypothetical protein TrVFT333_009064 [Trichoderma virens FT-333]